MKHSLFLILGLCATVTLAQAQQGNAYNPNYARNDKWIDSDALENMAIQRLENALNKFNNEATGAVVISTTRGGPTIDLREEVRVMGVVAKNLRNLTRGRREPGLATPIASATKSLEISAATLINSIPGMTRGASNLLDNVLEIIKSVGAVKLALEAPRSAGPVMPQPPVIEPRPPVRLIDGGYCSLKFTNWSEFVVSASGADMNQARLNTYGACASISGSNGTVSNTQACQSKITSATCLDAYQLAAAKDPYSNHFTSCTMSFTNWSSYVTNSVAGSMVEALAKLWESCKMSGSNGTISNTEACRQAFVNQKFSCTVQ